MGVLVLSQGPPAVAGGDKTVGHAHKVPPETPQRRILHEPAVGARAVRATEARAGAPAGGGGATEPPLCSSTSALDIS